MGNALDFLNNADNSKRAKREKYRKQEREKIEKFKEAYGVTKLDDVELEKIGSNYKVDGVNNKFKYEKTIKGINARRYKNRESASCSSSVATFTPHFKSGYTGRGELSEICFACSGRSKKEREAIRDVGGVSNYMELTSKLDRHDKFRKYTTLYEVENQIELRKKLHREEAKSLHNAHDRIVGEAYILNDKLNNRDNTIRTEEDFDF